jgi:hypothetical protein
MRKVRVNLEGRKIFHTSIYTEDDYQALGILVAEHLC